MNTAIENRNAGMKTKQLGISDLFITTHNLALVECLRAIGKRRCAAPGALAIAWTLSTPAVTGAIVGARTRDQVADVVAAAGVCLTRPDLRQIENVAELAGSAR